MTNSDAATSSDHLSTIRNAARALYGTPPFLVQHGWRQRYVHRNHTHVDELTEAPPPLHPTTDGSPVQTRRDGHGPIVMRSFEVTIANSELSAVQLMRRFKTDSNDFVPKHIAGFLEGNREVRSMEVGDEFVVEIPGPWNGPVRVDGVTDTSVLLITLEGHMEAGHIRFEVTDQTDTGYTFRIRSWARAGDELFEQLHLVVGLAHEAQTAMWVHACDRAVAVSGGSRRSDISVQTEQLNGSDIDE